MSYEGDTFTYRAMPERAPRHAASRPARTPAVENQRLTGWDRLAQVEGALASLSEQVEQLGAMVRELTEAAEAGRAARLQAAPAPARPAVSVADAPEAMRETQRVTPAVVQTMTQGVPEPPAPPQDVKVSFFADGGTKAVVGQAKVIQQ